MASYTYGPSQISSIRSALAAGNNTVTLSSGTYQLTSSTPFTFGNNTTLIGSSGTIIRGGTFGPMFTASSKSNITIRNCEITHAAPSGNYGTAPWTDYYTMYFSSVSGLYIYNCNIHDGYGDFIICRSCSNIYVHDNYMYYSGHECLYALTCSNVNFYNNRCRTRENSACRLSGTSTNGANIYNNNIDGKKYGSSDACTGPGIQIDTTSSGGNVQNIRIYNNNIHDVLGAGIWAQSDNTSLLSRNVYIYDNTFTNCGSDTAIHQRAAINTFQIHNLYIERNTFTNCGTTNSKCALRLIYRAASGAAQQSSQYTIYFRHNIGQQTVIKEYTISVKPYYTTNSADKNITYNINNHTVVTSGSDVTTPGGGVVTPPPDPVVDTTTPKVSIKSEPTSMVSGSSVDLKWTASGCTSATLTRHPTATAAANFSYLIPLDNGVNANSGTIPAGPPTSCIYRITGVYDKVEPIRSTHVDCPVTVTASPVLTPSITSITTSKTTVYTNEAFQVTIIGAKNYTSAVLEYDTTSTTKGTMLVTGNLNNGNGTCTVYLQIAQPGNKNIVLTLTNDGIVKTFAPAYPVTVVYPPTPATPTLTFTASFTEIVYGDQINLNWVASNTTSITINGESQSSLTAGFIPVAPGEFETNKSIAHTYTYTCVASNTSYGITTSTTQAVNITVNPYIPKIPLVRLQTNTQTIDIDQSAVISWFAENTTSLSGNNGIGPINPISGSTTVSPLTTTMYTFSAIGDDGGSSTYITINVLESPIISQFVASPATVYPGDPVTLGWVSRFGKYGNINNSVGSVNPTRGATTVNPTSTTSYAFTVSGSMGTEVKTVDVTVLDEPPSGSLRAYYTIDQPLIYIGETATISWNTENADVMACGQDIGFVDVPSGSLPATPQWNSNYEFILAHDLESASYDVPIYVMDLDYEFINQIIPTYDQSYIDITGRRIYVSGGQSTSDTSYTWDIDTNASMRPNPSDEMITFSYDEDGYYMITLTSVDRDGDVLKQTVRANVVNE